MTHGSAPAPPRSALVVTAHAGGFVWRAGGAIALAAARGEKVTVACLTFGERGESAKAWREGRSLEEIKGIRREEAEAAAAVLGAEVVFFDAGDYPLITAKEEASRAPFAAGQLGLDRYGLRETLVRLGVHCQSYEEHVRDGAGS